MKIINFLKMFIGSLVFFQIQLIISIVFSALIYFRKINKHENYFLSITIGNNIYIKIYDFEFLSFIYDVNSKSLVYFSYSSLLSFYLFFWEIFLFILEVTDADNNKIILAQFIIGCIIVVFNISVFCLSLGVYLKSNEKNSNKSVQSENYANKGIPLEKNSNV